MEKHLFLPDEAATVKCGALFAKCAKDESEQRSIVVYLDGRLGAGKTTFCRGVLGGFDHSGAVKSPTYTLVEPYELDGYSVFHFDLYRLADPEELEYIGIRDYFRARSICLVEWPSRGEGLLPKADLIISLDVSGEGRAASINAKTDVGVNLLQAWSALTGDLG